jgi:hypothetical protein
MTDDAKNVPIDKGRDVILKFEDDSYTCSPTDSVTERPRPKPDETLVIKAVLDLQIVDGDALCPSADDAVKPFNPKLIPKREIICVPVAAAFVDLVDETLR